VYRHKDRSSIEISLTASSIRDANGGITGASKIAHDISERKEAEQRQHFLTNELSRSSGRSTARAARRGSNFSGRSAMDRRLRRLPTKASVASCSKRLLHRISVRHQRSGLRLKA
jgi:hypothetical protein